MCILRVSSLPTGLVFADFFVPASVPSAEVCLEDTIASTKGKLKKVGAKRLAELLRHPYLLGGPQRQARGAKSKKDCESA